MKIVSIVYNIGTLLKIIIRIIIIFFRRYTNDYGIDYSIINGILSFHFLLFRYNTGSYFQKEKEKSRIIK